MKFELTAKKNRKTRTLVWEDGDLSGDGELVKAARASLGGTIRVPGYGEVEAAIDRPLVALQFLYSLLEEEFGAKAIKISGEIPEGEAVPEGQVA